MTLVTTGQFTITDVNDALFVPNILKWYEQWNIGSSLIDGWTIYGDAAENMRASLVDPFGFKSTIWRCVPDADGGASGGFTVVPEPIDPAKLYRYTCFVKRVGDGVGTIEHGCGGVKTMAGSFTTTGIFYDSSTLNIGEWYLLVGFIHPETETIAIGKSGIYSMSGRLLAAGNEYKFASGVTPTFFTRLTGGVNAVSEYQLFNPTFECINGTEESIADLVHYDASEFDYLTEVLKHGETATQGGLLTTNLIQAAGLDKVVRSGISGLAEDNIGFWTGGSYQDALSEKASNIIHKDGSIRLGGGALTYDKADNKFALGDFRILNGEIIGLDSNSKERVRMSRSALPEIGSISQGWAYFSEGIIGGHPAMIVGDEVDHLPSDKWVFANSVGTLDVYKPFTLEKTIVVAAPSQIRLEDVQMEAWIYNVDPEASTITATWGIYNASTGAIVYPSGGPVSTSTAISVGAAGTYKLKVNLNPRITNGEPESLDPYQQVFFEASFRCSAISFQGTHARSMIGQDGIMSWFSATSYLYYKESYGFQARFGNMGIRITSQGIEKMINGTTWTADTVTNEGTITATTYNNHVLSNLHLTQGQRDVLAMMSVVDGYLKVTGNLSLSSADGTFMQIGSGRLVWDNTNNALKVIKADGTAANFYATGSNSALGIGTSGGGVAYDRLDAWGDYAVGREGWVLSALLGNDLHNRVTTLENTTPNIAWGSQSSDYVQLSVNSVVKQLSIQGHSHSFASLSSKPTTIAGYGITDSIIYEGDARLTNARPASDVQPWAKAASKPSYSYTDVGAAAASHAHGNITSDGKIGTTANLVVVTGTAGALTAKTAGTTAQYLRGDGSWATPPDTIYVHPTKTSRNVGGGAHFITAFTSDTLGHVTGITTAAMTKADVEAVLVGNSITSHYHDDRYFQKDELFTKEGSGTEGDPYRIKANFPFYGVSSVAALGVGIGGGGTAYDRLDTWASYDSGKAGWVLSAALGYDLHGRVSTLESSTPNISWGVAGSGYIPLAVNGVSHQLSTYGHTHTKSNITDFAHTHDDRYYTETEIGNIFAGTTAITGYNKSNWDGVYTAFNAMQVGGRNLLKDSTNRDRIPLYGCTADITDITDSTVPSKKAVRFSNIVRSNLTLIFFLSVSNSPANFSLPLVGRLITVSFFVKANIETTISLYSKACPLLTTWSKVWFSIIYSSGNCHFSIPGDGLTTVDVSSLKVEIGNVATDWTPAPEDVDASIAAVQANLTTHAGLTNNPHAVTKTQVGLSNVDNTADSAKNVLSATKLTTARTLWGQSFDGTANVSGAITGATTISASSTISATTAILSNLTAGYVPYHTAGGLVNGPIYTDGTKVGIGLSSPASEFHIKSAYPAIILEGNNAGVDHGRMHFRGGRNGSYLFNGDYLGEIAALSQGSPSTTWLKKSSIAFISKGDYYSPPTDIVFSVSKLNISTPVEAMRISSDGNVGIGTSEPNNKLEVVGDYAQTIRLKAPTAGGGSGIVFADGGTPTKYNWFAGFQNNIGGFEITKSTIVGGTAFTSPAFVILSNNNRVGIGTTNPQDALDVNGNIRTSSADGSYIQIGSGRIVWDNTNNAIRVIKADGKAANFYATGSSTAFGVGGGAGGGGLITNVYGSAGFGGTYSDVDLSSTFNAYAINSLYTAIQGKQDTITGAISTLVSSNLHPNYALVSGATGKIQASGVTATELSYLSGASSNIQTQLNAKPSVNSYPTAFSWSAGSTSGPTGTLSGSNMTAVSFGAIPAASLTASGIVTTGSQTFAGEKWFASSVRLAGSNALVLDGATQYIYSHEQGEAIMTFDNDLIKVTHHWASTFEYGIAGSLDIKMGTALTFGLDAMPSGAIRFANGASGNESPVIIGKSTSVSTGTGLSLCAGTSETNNTGDMTYNVRRNTGTDFTDMTKEAYRWSRYATNLMTLARNGLFTLMPATNSLPGASQAAYTHAFSLNAANIPTYSTRMTDSGMGMIIMSMTADNNTGGADMMFNVRNAANTDYSTSYRTQVAFRWDRYGDTLMSLARNGALTVAGTASVTGLLTATGNIATANVGGAYVQIGPIKIVYDATNNALRFEGNVYATGSNAAFGVG